MKIIFFCAMLFFAIIAQQQSVHTQQLKQNHFSTIPSLRKGYQSTIQQKDKSSNLTKFISLQPSTKQLKSNTTLSHNTLQKPIQQNHIVQIGKKKVQQKNGGAQILQKTNDLPENTTQSPAQESTNQTQKAQPSKIQINEKAQKKTKNLRIAQSSEPPVQAQKLNSQQHQTKIHTSSIENSPAPTIAQQKPIQSVHNEKSIKQIPSKALYGKDYPDLAQFKHIETELAQNEVKNLP